MSFLRLPTIGQKVKKRQYDTTLIAAAYRDVVTKGMSVRKAATMYGIPTSTLRDRTLGLQPVPSADGGQATNPGPSPTLSHTEETKLVDHVAYMSSIGYGYSRNEFLRLATDFAVSVNKKVESDPVFAQSWYTSFKGRNPSLTLAKPQKLSLARAKSTSDTVLDSYFSELGKVIEKNGLQKNPQRIWNIDETGLMMEHSPTNVLCLKGTTPQAITSNRGKTVTIIACSNAAGTRLPPFYIFPGKRWNEDLMVGASPGAAGTMSESGWSNSTIFIEYLERHFLPSVPTSGSPVLVLFDGHKSHVNLTLTEWGKKHNVEFFVLPPHTSHVTQPLDVGCFGPLKNAYNSECQAFMRKTPGVQINRFNIASISSKGYNIGLTPDNLISSFRKTGIYPLERSQITAIKTAPAIIYNADNAENTTDGDSFLDSRKITKVTDSTKKRKSQPGVSGNIMSPSKEPRMKKIQFETPVTSKKGNVSTSKRGQKKPLPTLPQPSTSTVARDSPNDSEDYESEVVVEKDLCCVCKRFSPPPMSHIYTIDIMKWGQCDVCDHWTHLKYCSKMTCLRRDSVFMCPHCEI